jgi:TolB-like protein
LPMKTKSRRLPAVTLLISLFVLVCLVPVAAHTLPVNIAFLSIDNLSANPRYDYLEGIIRGLLLFDLSGAQDINVVNRSDLDAILREQELQLSNLAEDQNKAIEVGRILGADYLLRGEYVFLGNDVLITVRLIDVVQARSLTFSERGASENTLHAIAEQIIFRLTGREVTLQSEQHERSIISLQDEKPGSVQLFSHLIDAEIFVDGEFVGYTTGDPRVPFEIEDLSPGPHILRIHLSGFGVVKEPEITFHDWEEVVQIAPGKRSVVRAKSQSFNHIIYNLQQLLREDISFRELEGGDPVRREHDASFVGRDGKPVTVNLIATARREGDLLEYVVDVSYDGKNYRWDLSGPIDEKKEIREQVGKVEVRLEVDSWEVSYAIWRRDIEQGMHRNQ